MGEDKIRETDMANINKLLADANDHAHAVHIKAFELNNRTAPPTEAEKATEKPQGDIGTEIREKLIRINTILVEAITSLEAFV